MSRGGDREAAGTGDPVYRPSRGVAAAVGMAGQADADGWETTPPTVPYAGSAPGTGDTAQAVINNLVAGGMRVTVNKIGEAPLDRCKVTSTTPGSPISTQVSGG